jgi:hypothetical protein
MTERTLEADYVIVGAGAVAMAFADTLLTDTKARPVGWVELLRNPSPPAPAADGFREELNPSYGPSRCQSEVGRSIASESQRARDCQQQSMVGEAPGSFRSDPAGMMTSRPLRVACGSGEPHSRQNEVEKLRAAGKSKRIT